MTNTQEHYESHLGPIYSWSLGGAETAISQGRKELKELGISPATTGTAIDLGAGFGTHSVPLAENGYNVLAIDSCPTLISELRQHSASLPIRLIQDDLHSFPDYIKEKVDLILCMGDTLTHLANKKAVAELINTLSENIIPGGYFIATFRDYSEALVSENRFIPVQSDENRILTCFLEYSYSHVIVHDILHERQHSHWSTSVSQYKKLRINPGWMINVLNKYGFSVRMEQGFSGMIRLVAQRQS
ncbi:hypothetical protein HMF8227_02547 [Saliniradius amylolyticus]|uniref:Methyltransferase domain-containing protein n=1 Tax=Saliniradius amylolyticus TaxID=2183582 RepID=A0A2S2E5X3_9ALTE|nr:class I SAM-dependent methyltransferase [Saliniradius amylolyticus]AWL12999.1 hypothetical protein HMF8227_02547 [Saliniradius amylolyticus]